MKSHFKKLVQYFKLKRIGGTPKNYPFAALRMMDPSFSIAKLSLAQSFSNGEGTNGRVV